MQHEKIEIDIGDGKVVTIETGKWARQAAGSAVVSLGGTKVLVTVCIGPDKDYDFFPLTVEYREKSYAAGKIPGGYLKRESRPSDNEVLGCRLIDRPLRPLFPDGYKQEVQIVASVISSDGINDPQSISILGASLAVGLSEIPFEQQIAAVRVAKIGDKYIINPSYHEAEEADLEMIVAGSESSIVMVEGGAFEVSEETVLEGIQAGHEVIKKLIAAQNELVAKAGKSKIEFVAPSKDLDLEARVRGLCVEKLRSTFNIPMVKHEHYPAMAEIKKSVLSALAEEFPDREGEIAQFFGNIEKNEMRELILGSQKRIDGRTPQQIRDIEIELGVLPYAHGSAIFQRGETQALVISTLGSKVDEKRMDSLQGDYFKNYYLHYNFPPFSVGEVGRMSGPGRREIGHGHLAERSLAPVLPTGESFPYTLRIVSEILESNGSSSMASVCGGSLSLMSSGVPIKSHVAGIAMGLIYEENRVEILSDITGTEDHLGDMDFKICGTREGITGFQMDIKIKGITAELMMKALSQAKEGRLHILEKMESAIQTPNEISKLAPSILKRNIPVDKIKDLIGPGGKVIRGIQEKAGVNLDISDSGEVVITAPKKGNADMALKLIDELFAEVEVGKIYNGKVKNITTFGAFVEVLPGKEGLVHVSELGIERGAKVEDHLSTGDELVVKCINIDPQGRVRLSATKVNEEEPQPAG